MENLFVLVPEARLLHLLKEQYKKQSFYSIFSNELFSNIFFEEFSTILTT